MNSRIRRLLKLIRESAISKMTRVTIGMTPNMGEVFGDLQWEWQAASAMMIVTTKSSGPKEPTPLLPRIRNVISKKK